MADEGIGLELPIVVIEHIFNSESHFGVVRSAIRKCAKKKMANKDGEDEEYFQLLKIKEVVQNVEKEGPKVERKELMILLRCKERSAHYPIYLPLNNKVEHSLRMSVYVFYEEGCIYPDKTPSKNPLNVASLRKLFKPNKSIRNPKLVDNKIERRRVIARRHARYKIKEGGFPK